MTPRRRAAPALACLALLAGCFLRPEVVREQRYPAAAEFGGPVRLLAVAPFQAALRQGRPAEGGEPATVGVSGSERGALAGAEREPERTYGGPGTGGDERDAGVAVEGGDAAALVARQVAEAIAARGVDVRAPEDVRRTLTLEDPAGAHLDPERTARQVAGELGVDALLIGQVERFRQREGEALGTNRPASVAFSVQLYSAPAGRLLWSGLFDETQEPLSANLFKTSRYPGGGTRWLRAEELSRWGAENVAKSMPFLP